MPKFFALPIVVEALSITNIGDESEAGLHITLENGEEKVIAPDLLARMTPEVGDYLVTAPDGYEYLNPKGVFESKYASVPVLEPSVETLTGGADLDVAVKPATPTTAPASGGESSEETSIGDAGADTASGALA